MAPLACQQKMVRVWDPQYPYPVGVYPGGWGGPKLLILFGSLYPPVCSPQGVSKCGAECPQGMCLISLGFLEVGGIVSMTSRACVEG